MKGEKPKKGTKEYGEWIRANRTPEAEAEIARKSKAAIEAIRAGWAAEEAELARMPTPKNPPKSPPMPMDYHEIDYSED